MLYRKLGNTGLDVSVLGFGGWGIGGNDWKGGSDEESLKSIAQAMELGINFYDSALGYGGGHSEMLIGKAVKGKQDKFIITSKIPPKNYTWPQVPGTPIKEAYPKEWIIECTEKSLKNYNLDYIDLQQFHVWLNEWTDESEWQEAVEILKRDGKIRFMGASVNFPYTAADNGVPSVKKLDTLQVVHNIYQQEAENDIFVAAKEFNTGIIARCPLDEGALSGKITPEIILPEESFIGNYFRGDRKKEVYEHNKAMNWLMEEGYAENLAEAAIRYCLSFTVVSSVIVGMRSSKHTITNCAAAAKGALPAAVLARLKAHAWDHNYWL
ncbi:MAG: aldo/keto reductase [Clostridia bacterium]